MIFVDTNVLMYAVGREHSLREPSREFFARHIREDAPPLCTSAEVLQELMHAYLPAGRKATLDAALELATASIRDIWAVEAEDIVAARALVEDWPALTARDLLHLACCQRRGVRQVKTFDRALATAVGRSRA